MERLVFPFASNLKSHWQIKTVRDRAKMVQEDNKLKLAIMCKWNGNFRSDQLRRKKRSSNLRAPFAFQPVELQIWLNEKRPWSLSFPGGS